ncbi:hypothetical protein DVH24_015656 [Malus domestica]|uniref:Uncharacterized protein n=1 Tax=Malus domestica TaxID=3750 RepID=A0A498HL58_MALDO|nr:hypothetical protein DVH24_015656 [Malus domestica]
MAMEGEQGGGVGISALLMQMGEWIWSEKTIWVVEISGRRGPVLGGFVILEREMDREIEMDRERRKHGVHFLGLINGLVHRVSKERVTNGCMAGYGFSVLPSDSIGYALFQNKCLLFCFPSALLEPSFDFWVSCAHFCASSKFSVELSICLYPQHQLTTILDPSSLLLDLVLNEKAPPGINFLPLILAAPQWKDIVFGAIFMDFSHISISSILPESPLTIYLGMREDWVAKNAKQLAPKPVDMSVSSNNLVEDGARGSDASYGGGSCSSSGKIPWASDNTDIAFGVHFTFETQSELWPGQY